MSTAPPLAMGATLEHMFSHSVCIRSVLAPTGVRRVNCRGTRVGAEERHMHTVWLTMCSTVALMARGGAGDIPSNGPVQGITSSSTYTHVQGAYGAPTGAVGAPPTAQFLVTMARSS